MSPLRGSKKFYIRSSPKFAPGFGRGIKLVVERTFPGVARGASDVLGSSATIQDLLHWVQSQQ